MANLLPQCIKCDSPVTDSLQDEIEQHWKIKAGSYINGVWTCNDCIAKSQGQDKKTEQEKDSSSSPINRKSSSSDQQDTVGVASKSDVSPNTPRADE
jgi:hypothetical protein